MDAVIDSGRAVSETALAFGISWWLVQQVIGDAALRLPDVDLLVPRISAQVRAPHHLEATTREPSQAERR